ncbi:MAG TPA: sucrose phosphorylase [Burkholderiaceae bacterium]|nr:sucrose phosphorylase [Burkholderiaceae bacterium]
MKNQVQLITYVDRLGGGGLKELAALLQGRLAGLFGGVHLLPFFYPIDGADAGFDPIDHTQVDPRLGDWGDIEALAAAFDVMGDVIVNHVSSQSPQFLDYVARGDASPHAGLFLSFGSVFPDGATERDLLAVYRPRPGLPFTSATLAQGEKKLLWTTFTPQQVDIDVRHPRGQAYLDGILSTFAANGIRSVRLDAVGYAIKKAGTSCFMLPETFDFIGEFAGRAKALGIEVLVEIHSYYQRQIEIAKKVDWVYDFALPPLVLHALHFGTAAPLERWIDIRPHNALTVLDTHDGIGIIDIGADAGDRAAHPGLVPPAELDALVEAIHAASGGQSRRATGAAASNLDLYQVNCTFYDALGRDDRAYLIARAIQFFLPGVPQVYYVGLLAGENDMDLLERTQVGRDINRHHYTRAEIDAALARPVVQDLLELIGLRNRHPAFGGRFERQAGGAGVLTLRWHEGATWVALTVDLAARSLRIEGDDGSGVRRHAFRC